MRFPIVRFPQHMLRPVLIGMTVMVIVGPGAAPAQEVTPQPTAVATLTSTPTATSTLTPTVTATITPSPTVTSTATATLSATLSPSATPTVTDVATLVPSETATLATTATATPPSPTWTAIVETVVVPQTVVITPPVLPTLPPPVIIIPTFPPPPTALPPVVVQPPPPPAASPTPGFGWQRFESSAFIAVIGSWGLGQDSRASAGGYRQSASAGATLRFPFTGDGVRVIYRAQPQGGRFELILDGTTSLAVVDTHADEVAYHFAGPFFVEAGYHVLDVVALAPRSGETAVAIDAVEVFRGPPLPTRIAPTTVPGDPASEATRQPVANIALISQPPTPQPTATPIPDVLVEVEVVVAYDLNRNDSADADEGVQGISARMLDTTTNRLLASGLTDERGFVRLQAVTANPVTVAVPYFGETFPVRAGRGRSQSARWTLLLEAGTQPGLIP
ncbi:MAG: hypothetical protein ACOCXR_01650 [Phototrophicaceae bacterium]